MQRSRRFIHLFRREDSHLSYYFLRLIPKIDAMYIPRRKRSGLGRNLKLEIFSLRVCLIRTVHWSQLCNPDVSQEQKYEFDKEAKKMVPQIDPAALHYHGPTKKNDNFFTDGSSSSNQKDLKSLPDKSDRLSLNSFENGQSEFIEEILAGARSDVFW